MCLFVVSQSVYLPTDGYHHTGQTPPPLPPLTHRPTTTIQPSNRWAPFVSKSKTLARFGTPHADMAVHFTLNMPLMTRYVLSLPSARAPVSGEGESTTRPLWRSVSPHKP